MLPLPSFIIDALFPSARWETPARFLWRGAVLRPPLVTPGGCPPACCSCGIWIEEGVNTTQDHSVNTWSTMRSISCVTWDSGFCLTPSGPCCCRWSNSASAPSRPPDSWPRPLAPVSASPHPRSAQSSPPLKRPPGGRGSYSATSRCPVVMVWSGLRSLGA